VDRAEGAIQGLIGEGAANLRFERRLGGAYAGRVVGGRKAGIVKCAVLSGSNSVVECDLAKVEVAGSNPVSRSRFFLRLRSSARYPSGKGEVCKTFIREFDSHPRLHSFL
jgi:hypothetical protein